MPTGNRVKRPKTWRAEIPLCPPSANVYIRLNIHERKVAKGLWYIDIYAAFARGDAYAVPTKATGRRRVRVTVRSKNMRDYANLWLGVDKLIFDNLTKLGWIVDDSPKWMTPEVVGEVGEPHTTIEVFGEGL